MNSQRYRLLNRFCIFDQKSEDRSQNELNLSGISSDRCCSRASTHYASAPSTPTTPEVRSRLQIFHKTQFELKA